MSAKMRENIQHWLPLIEKVWKTFKGSRHSAYARFLAILGVGLLSPSVVDIVFRLFDLLDPKSCPPEKVDFGAIGGLLCISGSIISFVWGEIISVRNIRAAEKSEGNISLSFEEGWNFMDAANQIAQVYNKPIQFNGFNITECRAPITSGKYEFSSSFQALAALGSMTGGVINRHYFVEEQNGVFFLTIGEN